MRYLFISLAIAGLILVLVPVLLYYFGTIASGQMKTLAFLGTVIWFSGAIPWLGKRRKET